MKGEGRPASASVLEIKALLYFMAVVEQGSFTRAAKQRGVTQPALSFHISELEAELGVELLERTREGARATVFGQMLYEQSLPIIRKIVGLANGVDTAGVVRLGLPPALCDRLLPEVLDEFFATYPRVSVEVREGFGAALNRDIEAGLLDFAIGGWSADSAALRLEFAYEEDLFLVSSEPVGGVSRTSCRLDEVSDLHLICVSETHPLGALIASHIARGNIRPARTVVIDGFAALRIVLRSSWSAILPRSAVEALRGQDRINTYQVEFPRINYQVYGISNSKIPLRPPARFLKEKLVAALSQAGMGRVSERSP